VSGTEAGVHRSRRTRATGAVAAAGTLLLVAAGCRTHTELAATCTSYRTGQASSASIISDIEAPARVVPGQTFTVTVEDLHVWGVGSGTDARFPNGILTIGRPASPEGDVVVGEDVLSGGTPLPNTLTLTAHGTPGDTITVRVRQAQSYFSDILPGGDRITCDGGDRPVATIEVVAPAVR
jgi:hypothetical protein